MPNGLVYRSDEALFFTDPPFGLPKFADDPRREQPHFGVYSVNARPLFRQMRFGSVQWL
jgi:gluconolactonase